MENILTISKSMKGKVCVLRLAGRLDGSNEGLLLKTAQEEHDAGVSHLLLDLSQLETLTSAGLRAFHAIYKLFLPAAEIAEWEKAHPEMPYKSTCFKLAGTSSEIYYVLNIAGFLHNIPVFADLHEGLNSFGS